MRLFLHGLRVSGARVSSINFPNLCGVLACAVVDPYTKEDSIRAWVGVVSACRIAGLVFVMCRRSRSSDVSARVGAHILQVACVLQHASNAPTCQLFNKGPDAHCIQRPLSPCSVLLACACMLSWKYRNSTQETFH